MGKVEKEVWEKKICSGTCVIVSLISSCTVPFYISAPGLLATDPDVPLICLSRASV